MSNSQPGHQCSGPGAVGPPGQAEEGAGVLPPWGEDKGRGEGVVLVLSTALSYSVHYFCRNDCQFTAQLPSPLLLRCV